MNGTKLTRYTSTNGEQTIFVPLPAEQWSIAAMDGKCACPVCKADGDTLAFWDTLVIPVKAPRAGRSDYASVCHYPELHPKQNRIAATVAHRAKIAS